MKMSSRFVRASLAAVLALITLQLLLVACVLLATGNGTAAGVCFVACLLFGPAACQTTLDLR